MIFLIKNAQGEVIDTIVANADFVQQHYEFYEEVIDHAKLADEAREWRDAELSRTDMQSLLTDHSNKAALMQYRQALRDWPASPDFPDVRPTL